MASLTLNNVEFLAYTENMDFLDTVGFNFTSRRTMTVKGILLNLYNFQGIDQGQNGLTNQIATLRNSLNQYYADVYINSHYFGEGKLVSLNITSDDNFVHTAQYVAKLQTVIRYDELTSEQFSSPSTTDYAGLVFLMTEQLPARFIRSLTEQYTFERDNDRFGYTHSVSVTTEQITDGLQRVRQFAQSLFALTTPINVITPEPVLLNNNPYKPIYNEKFDLRNNSFTFTEKLSATNPDFTNNLSQSQAINFTMGENGIVTVTENGSVKSLTTAQPNLTPILTGVFNRIQGTFNSYNDESFTLYPLNSGAPIVNVFDYDEPNRTASYQVTYTNDPRFNTTYNWNYTQSIVKNGAYLSATENGRIMGSGNTSAQMFNNAWSAYPSIFGGVVSRLSPSLQAYYQTTTTLVKNQYKGIVEYSQTYTENPIFSDSNVISVEINIQDNFKTPVFNRFDVFNYGVVSQPLLDTNSNSTQGNKIGERNVSIVLQGRKTSNEASLKVVAENYANVYVPNTFNDVFLTNVSYSFEPIEKKFTLSASWNYN